MPANAFISYSHADEKALERLHKHLAVLRRDGTLEAWTDHAILAGGRFDQEIVKSLNASSIFIALVSPDYLASSYCYEKEFQHALKLVDEGKMRIVPIILEPCDWLSTPFKDFMALPKDGQPISGWTNLNNAYLDVVTRLRQLLSSPLMAEGSAAARASGAATSARRPRVKQDFDTIQRSEFADAAFNTIRDYFRASCAELSAVDDSLRTKFEEMGPTAFTCSVVNRGKRSGGGAHITVKNSKGRRSMGDITYVNERYHTDNNTSNGGISVDADDYAMFLRMDAFSLAYGGNREAKLTPEQAAEQLLNNFVKRAGVEYE